MYTVDEVIRNLKHLRPEQLARLPTPLYTGTSSKGISLSVRSMKDHTTDEGWQIMLGLESNGYGMCGYLLETPKTDLREILPIHNPGVVVVQDKREWDHQPGDFRDPYARFHNVSDLLIHPEIFSITILKDSHQRPIYHRNAALEQGCHAWIIYYHPRIVTYLASYIRPEHCIRTYHSLNRKVVPPFIPEEKRSGALLSGAVSSVYPLRQRLIRDHQSLPEVGYLRHPGYHRSGCHTPDFLKTLMKYKVSICTASIYGYALRKIIESTACGCKVLTDLPVDEVMPEIDGNLTRIHPSLSFQEIVATLKRMYEEYDPVVQKEYAEKAIEFYFYKNVGKRLVADIEKLRSSYVCSR